MLKYFKKSIPNNMNMSPPIIKDYEKIGYLERGIFSGTSMGIVEYDRTDASYYYDNPFISNNSYATAFHIAGKKNVDEHLKTHGYLDKDKLVTLADLYHKYTYGNFLPGGEFNNYRLNEEDIEFQKKLYNID